jgi:glutamate-5-semialdehyde dehydrogenase
MAYQTIAQMVETKAKAAKAAAHPMAKADRGQKDRALLAMALELKAREAAILEANKADMDAGAASGLSKQMLERLLLTTARLEDMARGLREVAALEDPVGVVLDTRERPNGLKVSRVRVPLGVIGIIYESRPNVTVDAAALCLKAGNAVILRGGSEAFNSNQALGNAIQAGLQAAGLPAEAVQVIDVKDRQAVNELLHRDREIDVIIPRGGRELIRFVAKESTIPVIRHDIGNCHVYVDAAADLKMAEEIAFNAKVQRPSVCNAMEHLLVHQDVADAFLPGMAARYRKAHVDLRGDEAARAVVGDLTPAMDDEWYEEYLDLVCGIKVVKDLDQAIHHINHYGSQHSDAIITSDAAAAERFLKEVDSATVYVNASTRFTDGSQLGLGAEIGISTQKLHARGPMGLEELTSVKFVIRGTGQVRA